jgi:hypothetical protein
MGSALGPMSGSRVCREAVGGIGRWRTVRAGFGNGDDDRWRVWPCSVLDVPGAVVLLLLVGVLDEAAGGCEWGSLRELGKVFVEEHPGDEFLA